MSKQLTQTATQAAIRQLGLTCRYRDGEYRVNLPKGTEATAYYTNDAADAIATAKRMAESVITPRSWLSAFRSHLLSEKFQGTEPICSACGLRCEEVTCVGLDYVPASKCCHERIRHDRKDLIATTDVLRWLDGLEELL